MHDVNAFVRSRVLQIWLTIVSEKVTDVFAQLPMNCDFFHGWRDGREQLCNFPMNTFVLLSAGNLTVIKRHL